ncbi:hypothetical protein GCM10009780_61630 [Actinomadura alba]
MADLALDLELSQRTELIGERHLRIDAVQLEQFESFDPEPAEGLLDLRAQEVRPPIERRIVRGVRRRSLR